MRHGVVASVGESTVVVELDGVEVTATLLAIASVEVGEVATLLQDGRRLVCLGCAAPLDLGS